MVGHFILLIASLSYGLNLRDGHLLSRLKLQERDKNLTHVQINFFNGIGLCLERNSRVLS